MLGNYGEFRSVDLFTVLEQSHPEQPFDPGIVVYTRSVRKTILSVGFEVSIINKFENRHVEGCMCASLNMRTEESIDHHLAQISKNLDLAVALSR